MKTPSSEVVQLTEAILSKLATLSHLTQNQCLRQRAMAYLSYLRLDN